MYSTSSHHQSVILFVIICHFDEMSVLILHLHDTKED